MPPQAITFDFHDTLVHCDAWFELEVSTLVSAFLTWRATTSGCSVPVSVRTAGDALYRRLRASIIHHGHEVSAERCLGLVLMSMNLSVDRETIETGVRALMLATLPSSRVVPGAPALLASLQRD